MSKKHLSIIICIALLMSCLGVSKLLSTAIADTTLAEVVYDTLGISDTLDDDTSAPDEEAGPAAEPDQESEETEDPEETASLEFVNTDSLPILEDDTDLPIFKNRGTPETDAPMISVSTSKIEVLDGKEFELINDNLSFEEKRQYLSQGFSIQDIYAASEIAYDYQTDAKAILEKAQEMVAEQNTEGRINSAEAGLAKINWEAVDKRIKKEEIKNIFDNVKGQYPQAVAKMTKQGIPVEIQLNIIMIQTLDETAKVDDLVTAYKGQGKDAIKSRIEQSMKGSIVRKER